MPVWTLSEILAFGRIREVEPAPLTEGYELVGGMVRNLFANPRSPLAPVKFVEKALSLCNPSVILDTLQQEFKSNESAGVRAIVHLVPFDNSLRISTTYVLDKLISWASDDAIWKAKVFVRSTEGGLVSSLRGSFYEGLMRKCCETLSAGGGGGRCLDRAGVEENVCFPVTEVVRYKDVTNFIALPTTCVYYRPLSKNEAAIDALLYDPACPRVVSLLLQMSVSRNHGVKVAAAKRIVEHFVNLELGVVLRFYFVVPTNLFDAFRQQPFKPAKDSAYTAALPLVLRAPIFEQWVVGLDV